MRLLRRLVGYARIFGGWRRNRLDLVRFLVRRPALMVANNVYEGAMLVSNRVDARLKYLSGLRAAQLAGCPF